MPELEGDRKQGNYLGEEGLSFLWGPTSHYGTPERAEQAGSSGEAVGAVNLPAEGWEALCNADEGFGESTGSTVGKVMLPLSE